MAILARSFGLDEGAVRAIPIKENSAIGRAIAQVIEGVFGRRAVVVDFGSTGIDSNGIHLSENPGVLYINKDANRPAMVVLGHELLHDLRETEPALYADLKALLEPMLGEYGPYREFVDRNRVQHGLSPASTDLLIEEMIGDLLGDSFGDPAFWKKVSDKNPGLFERVMTAIKRYLDTLVSTMRGRQLSGTQYFKDYKAARDVIAGALGDHLAGPKVSPDTRAPVRPAEPQKLAELQEATTRVNSLKQLRLCLGI